MNLTPQQYKDLIASQQSKSKPNKFKAERVEYDGEKWDSKKELARFGILRLLEQRGDISELRRQVKYELTVNGLLIAKYYADFTYMKNGELIVEDTKSKHTRTLPVYRIKRKLMFAIHNIQIQES